MEIQELTHEMQKANKIRGIKNAYPFDFPDHRFDSIPLLDIVKKIARIKVEMALENEK